MIKLIASDLDGTLLLNRAQSLTDRQIDIIDRVLDKGIIFAAASGRQCRSLEMLFGKLSDRMLLIAENGALVKYKGELLAKNVMDKNLALAIINDAYNRNNCEVLISGQTKAYIRPKTQEYLDRMTKIVKYDCEIIDDFSAIDEDILKVAVCDLSGAENSAEYFHKKYDAVAKVTVSGALYIDFTDLSVNKGTAMAQIQKSLKITPEECMAFGDNFNDVELLDSVSESFVMDTAVDGVKTHGKHIVSNVENTLEDIILK